MNSKEALEKMYYGVGSEQENNEAYMAIYRSLDKLEQLEKENQGLKEVRDNYSDQLNYVWNIVNSLKDENTRLKQAIKILKEKFEIEVTKTFCPRIVITETNELENNDSVSEFLTQREYELLKEMIESEGDSDEKED